MPKNISKINFVDLEATCWEGGFTPSGHTQRSVSEIIEIGIAQVDTRSLTVESKESYIIKPEDYPILTRYCINLTGITQDMVNAGTTLDYGIARMMSEYKTAKYEWMSWGDYDRTQFEKECELKGFQYPFGRTHTNFKYWFSLLTNQNKQRNVKGALDYLHLEFEGNAHRAVDDAYNTALIYIETMKMLREIPSKLIINQMWGD